ncbi:Beta-glucuronosyltransferase [Nymphaea thermarum]|nr:Beta-glucuronosyltransferase [Nymphaea thermarum]
MSICTGSRSTDMDKKLIIPLLICVAVLVFLIAASNFALISTMETFCTISSFFSLKLSPKQAAPVFVETKITPPPSVAAAPIARLAYLVSGSKGDLDRLWRTLHAIYHPLNQYVVHLDLEAPAAERLELAIRVKNDPVFSEVGNVHMITKANLVTYRGPTMVSNTLHACAILLKKREEWDWFINLSASDYPLVTQDGNPSCSCRTRRARPLVVDPGLYLSHKTNLFWVTQKRDSPTAFKLFTGSAWVGLSRSFVEFCIWGWDNLPRILLMYYANFLSSPEGYFQTVICNSAEFHAAVVNHDLHYISWDVPPRQHPRMLTLNDTDKMIYSNAPFARKFRHDDPVLDRIDTKYLKRKDGNFTPGGWCAGNPPCSRVGNKTDLRPGPGARRLARLMKSIVHSSSFSHEQCT